jgi:hypothetical protein
LRDPATDTSGMKGLRNLEFHFIEIGFRDALADVQNLDTDNLFLLVVVEHNAWSDFLGIDDLRIVQTEVERV